MRPRQRRQVDPVDLSRRIGRIVDDVLCRRLSGQTVPDGEVILQHLDLMPELQQRLEALQLVERAERAARMASAAAPIAPAKRYVRGHCPYCNAPYRLRAELADHKVRCRECRGVFLTEEFSAAVNPPHWPDNDNLPQEAREQ